MSTAREAEKYVKDWYKKQGIELLPPPKGEFGYDFKTQDGKEFIEVKGTKERELSKIAFRYLTNLEYVKIKECKRQKLKYSFHLIAGIGTDRIDHYIIPGHLLIKKALPEVSWCVPLTKDIRQYKIR